MTVTCQSSYLLQFTLFQTKDYIRPFCQVIGVGYDDNAGRASTAAWLIARGNKKRCFGGLYLHALMKGTLSRPVLVRRDFYCLQAAFTCIYIYHTEDGRITC